MQNVGETVVDGNGLPALSIKVTDVNRHQHLDGIVRFESLSAAQELTVGRTDISHRNVRRALAAKLTTQLKATSASFLAVVLLMTKRQFLWRVGLRVMRWMRPRTLACRFWVLNMTNSQLYKLETHTRESFL